MKTRKHNWYDPIKHAPVYGVQVRHEGQWKNAAIDGKLILCGTEAERDAERIRFRAAVRNGEYASVRKTGASDQGESNDE
jgi:hypothetical protein